MEIEEAEELAKEMCVDICDGYGGCDMRGDFKVCDGYNKEVRSIVEEE